MTIEEIIAQGGSLGPTFFQLHFFVIGKEPTDQAKLHKCADEMKVRVNGIRSTRMEIEDISDQITLAELTFKGKYEDIMSPEELAVKARMHDRKMTTLRNHVDTLSQKIEVWDKEIKFLKQIFDSINEKVEFKNWSDTSVQLEYWNEKLAQDIKQRVLMNAPLDIELIRTAMALPDVSPIKQQLVQHWLKVEENRLVASKPVEESKETTVEDK